MQQSLFVNNLTSDGAVSDVDVLIQTFNEEENLPHTLASLKGWVRNVFIVDSGSTDRTIEIAREYGATVVQHAWEGYAAQKNWALEHLPFQSNWILILDADESVSLELREEISGIVSRAPERMHEAGFYLNRVFIFMGRQIRHCGYFPSWNLRLFKRGKARYEDRMVHEHMVVDGPTGYLKHLLLHEDRRGLEHFFAKHNRYSTLEAREIFESPEPWPGLGRFFTDRVTRRRFVKSRILPYLPLPWTWRLIYMYVIRGGFLDGRAGWVLSNFISSYEFFIQTKYQELRRLRGRQAFGYSGLAQPEGQISFHDQTGVAQAAEIDTVEFNVAPPGTAKVVLEAPARVSTATVATSRLTIPHRPAVRAPVSVMIPTLNEAANLPRCLDHLQWADEVVVVDSGSTDETKKIAEAYGAKVIDFKWNGLWPKKKNWALRNVDWKHQWILIVDADEWITPELAQEIQRAVTTDDGHVGYYINRRFIFMGRWIKHCGYYPSWNGRLIKRGSGEYEQLTGIGNTGSGDNEVHEHVIYKDRVGYLDHDMLHFAFPNIHTFMEKHNRYSNWEAAVQFSKADTSSAVVGNEQLSKRRQLKNVSRHLPFRPMLRFLYSYIWKGGFLDGAAGYVFCRLLAIYEYLSVAKYHELKRAEDDQRKARLLSAVPEVKISVESGEAAYAEPKQHVVLGAAAPANQSEDGGAARRRGGRSDQRPLGQRATQRPSINVTPKRNVSPWTSRQRIGRLLWAIVYRFGFRCSFHNWYGWRAAILKMFGAKLGRNVRIRRTVKIEIPWNLDLGDDVSIGDEAILYSLGMIQIGNRSFLSQYAHLCAGTHDHTSRDYPLMREPIKIGEDCWIAADAFVGPGVTIGDRTVLGARASAFSDLAADVIAVGNPAKAIRARVFRD